LCLRICFSLAAAAAAGSIDDSNVMMNVERWTLFLFKRTFNF
jgi:hypothetical protein